MAHMCCKMEHSSHTKWTVSWWQPSCHKHIIQRGAHLHDFLKKIIQGLVGMGDEQCALGRTIVVKYIQDLDSCICLASTRWTHHHGQPWLHPWYNCTYLFINTDMKLAKTSINEILEASARQNIQIYQAFPLKNQSWCKEYLHTGLNVKETSNYLNRSEPDRILFWLILWIWPWIWWYISFHQDLFHSVCIIWFCFQPFSLIGCRLSFQISPFLNLGQCHTKRGLWCHVFITIRGQKLNLYNWTK